MAVYGDVNSDDIFNIKDMIYIKKVLSLYVTGADFDKAFDLNGDNAFSSLDIVALKKELLYNF